MKEPFVFLRPEITREHASAMANWLQDEEVLRYLSDARDISRAIHRILERVNLPVLTHLFSSEGRFFIVSTRHGAPLGFVRLARAGEDCEIVLVIGDRSNWGKRLGTRAIRESLKEAFFGMRVRRVIARIDKENRRSARAFLRAGFTLEREAGTLRVFSITMEQFMQAAQAAKEETAMPGDIYITEIDRERLDKLIETELRGGKAQGKDVRSLAGEVGRAIVVPARLIPGDVVTMNARALLELDGEQTEAELVYPQDADWSARKMSVFSPVGTAILGLSEGDRIEWEVPGGSMAICVRKVLYQPEAAGHYHL